MSNTPLIIVGTGDYAEVAFHYLQEDGNFDISGFAEEEAFINKRDFKGLPIYKVEELSSKFNGRDTKILVAVGPNKVNTVRERLYELIKSKGFSCISYIHPKAHVWNASAIGENSFIFPGCVIEPFTSIGENCVVWSNSVIAHHSIINNHCFIAPGCAISGRVIVERNCFLGIHSTVRDNVKISEKCIIGAGSVIKKDTEANGVYSATKTSILNKLSLTTKV